MFGSIGGGEILMILTLALLLFGPRRLPQIGKTLGRTLAEFRRATNDLKHSLEREVALEDLKELKVAGDDLHSAGREIAEAVSESNPLGVARGSLEAPAGAGPSGEPEAVAKADPAGTPSDDVPRTAGRDGEDVDRA